MIANAVRAATLEMGYEMLRGEQQTVIQSYVRDRDTSVSLPMGCGESLYYCAVFDQLRSTPGRSIALAVSPPDSVDEGPSKCCKQKEHTCGAHTV